MKYYCFDRNRWVTEKKFLLFFKIYKLTSYGKKSKWSFRASKSKMTKPNISKLTLTEQEAIEEFGPNKWTWPLEPYKYLK